MSDTTTTKIDPRTGAVIRVNEHKALLPPDPKMITDINKVAGKNPIAANLRDHPEFSGMDFYVVDAKFGAGEIGGKSTTFAVAAGFITAPGKPPREENAVVIITGADNVYARLAQAFAQNAFPVKGTLRKSGRAWFLD